MDNSYNIDWNNYLYKGNLSGFIEQLNKTGKRYKSSNLENIPSKNSMISRNSHGIPRFIFYGGFTPWTNLPISNKNGGNI